MSKPPMRRLVAVLMLSALAGAPFAAQVQPTTPAFRTGTTLIEFTVVARDAQGNLSLT